ncbi:hypothetical protein TNCV_4837831 [Trichonephila clavipes]|nr:hypothetical protein TNCV_4837831 [Trichonephila clavipes]
MSQSSNLHERKAYTRSKRPRRTSSSKILLLSHQIPPGDSQISKKKEKSWQGGNRNTNEKSLHQSGTS